MENRIDVFACKNRNNSIRQTSTSGGFFSALAESILSIDGHIYGAKFDDKFNVIFDMASNNGYEKFKGSKYPQAELHKTFKNIKYDLEQGINVLFVGTPCQVQGLTAYLNKKYENLYLVDFVCMGVASPGLWRKYLKEIAGKEKIISVKFKDKTVSWHKFHSIIETQSKVIDSLGGSNIFMKSYLTCYNLRPSCYECRFKGLNGRCSDITISDCWGIEKIEPEFDDDKGISGVYINSDKGRLIFDACEKIVESRKISFEDAKTDNPYYDKKACRPLNRGKFWKYIEHGKNIEYALKRTKYSEMNLKLILKKILDV